MYGDLVEAASEIDERIDGAFTQLVVRDFVDTGHRQLAEAADDAVQSLVVDDNAQTSGLLWDDDDGAAVRRS